MGYRCASKAQKWTVSSWVPGFINLPGRVMTSTATKKPQLHVNIIPEQVVGSTNHKVLLQAVLSASLESYSQKEARSCETIWAGMTVILEFHQERVGHNDMALDQSSLTYTWPVVWRGYTYCLDWDHLSLCPDSGQLYNGKRHKFHPSQHDDHCNTSDIPVLCPVNLCCVPFHWTELSVLQFHLNGYMTDGGHSLTLHFHLVCDNAVFILIIIYFS